MILLSLAVAFAGYQLGTKLVLPTLNKLDLINGTH